jgi:hypothetical protein
MEVVISNTSVIAVPLHVALFRLWPARELPTKTPYTALSELAAMLNVTPSVETPEPEAAVWLSTVTAIIQN